jgi:hypothetical protein
MPDRGIKEAETKKMLMAPLLTAATERQGQDDFSLLLKTLL